MGDVVGILRRYWRLVAVLALVAAGATAARAAQRPPVYEATASVLVRPLSATPIQTGRPPGEDLNMASEQQVLRSEAVARIAGKAMRVAATPTELLEHVSADVPARSQIVRVHFRDGVPATARRGANAFAAAYLAFRKQSLARQVTITRVDLQHQIAVVAAKKARQDRISSPDGAASPDARRTAAQLSDVYSDQLVELRGQLDELHRLDLSPGAVIEPAELPTSPAGPRPLASAGLGLAGGLLVGVLVALVRDRTDARLRGGRDLVERLDRPLLGQIPALPRRTRRRPGSSLVVLAEPNSPAAEAYRALRARLSRLAGQTDVKSIMVVSPGRGEGRTTTAANLAIALAESGRDTLLVSADLRRPRIHELFGLPNRSGLSDLLADEQATDQAEAGGRFLADLWSVSTHLCVILSGPPPPHPSALLDSGAMRQFLKEQRDLFDFLVLDCPAGLLVADSLVLASLVDGVLVVADAVQTDRSAVSRLREELEQADGRLLGSVLNRAPRAGRRPAGRPRA